MQYGRVYTQSFAKVYSIILAITCHNSVREILRFQVIFKTYEFEI